MIDSFPEQCVAYRSDLFDLEGLIMTLVAGIDGCTGGWCVTTIDLSSSDMIRDIIVVASFRAVLDLDDF